MKLGHLLVLRRHIMADAPTTLTFQVTDPNYGTLTWTPGPHILGHLHEPPLADYYQDQEQLRDEVEQILSKKPGEIADVLCAASQIIGDPFAMAMLALESAMAQLAADDSPLGTMSAGFEDEPSERSVEEQRLLALMDEFIATACRSGFVIEGIRYDPSLVGETDA